MKLQFKKDKKGKITLLMDEKKFDSSFYLKIVKNIAGGQKLNKPDFDGDFSSEEKENILEIVREINSIGDKSNSNNEHKESAIAEYPK